MENTVKSLNLLRVAIAEKIIYRLDPSDTLYILESLLTSAEDLQNRYGTIRQSMLIYENRSGAIDTEYYSRSILDTDFIENKFKEGKKFIYTDGYNYYIFNGKDLQKSTRSLIYGKTDLVEQLKNNIGNLKEIITFRNKQIA